jgi:hypothetical protein
LKITHSFFFVWSSFSLVSLFDHSLLQKKKTLILQQTSSTNRWYRRARWFWRDHASIQFRAWFRKHVWRYCSNSHQWETCSRHTFPLLRIGRYPWKFRYFNFELSTIPAPSIPPPCCWNFHIVYICTSLSNPLNFISIFFFLLTFLYYFILSLFSLFQFMKFKTIYVFFRKDCGH